MKKAQEEPTPIEFGNRERFAIAFELDADYLGVWLNGHFGYRIGGEQVGDYAKAVSLQDVMIQMKWVDGTAAIVRVANCVVCLGTQPFTALDQSIYGEISRGESCPPMVLDTPARFEIKFPVTPFDDWKIFLFECGSVATILYKRCDEESVSAFDLEIGEFDRVLKEAYGQLERWYDMELQNETEVSRQETK
jgi:Immunity protein 42